MGSDCTMGLSAYNQCPVRDSSFPFSPGMSQAVSAPCHPQPPPTSLPPFVLACSQPRSNEMMVSLHKPAALTVPPVAVPQLTPAAVVQPTCEPGVQQVVAMFDEVLSLCNAYLANSQRAGDHCAVTLQPTHCQPGCSHNQQRPEPFTCRVCGSTDNSSHSHCRLYRLAQLLRPWSR